MNSEAQIEEIFKQIKNTNFQISNLGNIKNQKTKVLRKISVATNNDSVISLTDLSIHKLRLYYVKKLVAQAFVENPNKYMHIFHKNGNKLDNAATNLEWCEEPKNQAPTKSNSGHRGIYLTKYGTYQVTVHDKCMKKTKTFKTEEEAIIFKKETKQAKIETMFPLPDPTPKELDDKYLLQLKKLELEKRRLIIQEEKMKAMSQRELERMQEKNEKELEKEQKRKQLEQQKNEKELEKEQKRKEREQQKIQNTKQKEFEKEQKRKQLEQQKEQKRKQLEQEKIQQKKKLEQEKLKEKFKEKKQTEQEKLKEKKQRQLEREQREKKKIITKQIEVQKKTKLNGKVDTSNIEFTKGIPGTWLQVTSFGNVKNLQLQILKLSTPFPSPNSYVIDPKTKTKIYVCQYFNTLFPLCTLWKFDSAPITTTTTTTTKPKIEEIEEEEIKEKQIEEKESAPYDSDEEMEKYMSKPKLKVETTGELDEGEKETPSEDEFETDYNLRQYSAFDDPNFNAKNFGNPTLDY